MWSQIRWKGHLLLCSSSARYGIDTGTAGYPKEKERKRNNHEIGETMDETEPNINLSVVKPDRKDTHSPPWIRRNDPLFLRIQFEYCYNINTSWHVISLANDKRRRELLPPSLDPFCNPIKPQEKSHDLIINKITFLAPSETDWIVLGWAWQTWIWRETSPGRAAQMAWADPCVSCCWSICCWSGPLIRKAASDRAAIDDACCDGGVNSEGDEPDNPKCLSKLKKKQKKNLC